jgi:hypothetical protein
VTEEHRLRLNDLDKQVLDQLLELDEIELGCARNIVGSLSLGSHWIHAIPNWAKEKLTPPTLARALDLAAVFFPPTIRDQLFVPYAEELKEDDLSDRKAFKTSKARQWVALCGWMKALHLFLTCLWEMLTPTSRFIVRLIGGAAVLLPLLLKVFK